MKLLISGSTGLVGRRLAEAFTKRGDTVVALGRADFAGDAGLIAEKVSGADIVINLAGAPIVARWSESYKQEILESRVNTTSIMVHAIGLAEKKPRLFISTSAVGIYPDGKIYTEANAEYGNDFLAHICKSWEAEAMKATAFTGVAIFRLGVVLSGKGGALAKMLLPFRLGIGGPIAGGRQGFSWIHIDDLINAWLFVIDNQLDGIFNLAAPEATDNAGFTKALGKAMHRPVFMPVPAFALRLLFGEGAITLTSGQKVIPERLLDAGFVFEHPKIEFALADLLG